MQTIHWDADAVLACPSLDCKGFRAVLMILAHTYDKMIRFVQFDPLIVMFGTAIRRLICTRNAAIDWDDFDVRFHPYWLP
jgi:hypothetical protein